MDIAPIRMRDTLTPKALAHVAGVSVATATRWCKTGVVGATKVGGRWHVPPDAVAKLLWQPCQDDASDDEPKRPQAVAVAAADV